MWIPKSPALRNGQNSTGTARRCGGSAFSSACAGGWAYAAIAREEGVTPRRIRQIVSEALQREKVDDASDHAMLQLARLEQALEVGAERVGAGDVSAIAPYLKVVAQLDRYQSAARIKDVYDDAARERLLDKINRVAARLLANDAGRAKPAAAPAHGGAREGPKAPIPRESRRFPWIRL